MTTFKIDGESVKTVTLVFTIDADVDEKLFQEAVTKLIHEGEDSLDAHEQDAIDSVWNLAQEGEPLGDNESIVRGYENGGNFD